MACIYLSAGQCIASVELIVAARQGMIDSIPKVANGRFTSIPEKGKSVYINGNCVHEDGITYEDKKLKDWD